MSCARNLLRCCESDTFESLWELTKQIFGMCENHGVRHPKMLFSAYKDFILGLLRYRSCDAVALTLHELVWLPSQRALRCMVGYSREEWSSMLMTSICWQRCNGVKHLQCSI